MIPKRLRTSSAGRSSGAYSYVRQRAVSRAVERPVSGTVAKEVDDRSKRRRALVADRRKVERRVALADAVTLPLAARRHMSSEAVTVSLDRATNDSQRQYSQTDPASATPRQESFAGLAEEGAAAEAIHEESFAGLLEE